MNRFACTPADFFLSPRGMTGLNGFMDMSLAEPAPSPGGRSRLTLSAILIYERADLLSGILLIGCLLFSPWAFGTTQSWAVTTMNLCGYTLGVLLAVKLWIRLGLGHQPLRWGGSHPTRSLTTWLLMAVTLLLLVYPALAALNGRADYDPVRLTLDYREYVAWLPHSYDRAATWAALAKYVAWACSFWALRDWLLGMSADEARSARGGSAFSGRVTVPARLKILLWVLVINGAALGLEGIIQRLEGSGKLLFLVKPRVNPGAETQFGPYAYRSNAAQYLNLIWPVALGFWWWLQQSSRRSGLTARHHWLLLCAAIMAACPIISTSRAGALTALVLLGLAVAVLITGRRGDGLVKLAVLGVFGLALAGGIYFGWASLNPRLEQLTEGFQTREHIYETARIIARENPVFGTGPGTFEHVFQIYRQSITEYWPAQLHNDWLELLLTFGGIGFGLMLLALALTIAHAWSRGGIGASRRFIWLVWIALGGCLLQARWDFPFQIYSIIWLFLLLCAVLTVVGRSGPRTD